MITAKKKLGVVGLAAATYCMVAGGPFGLEDLVSMAGYRDALFILVATPVLWALPTTIMVSQLTAAMPETGGFYVWVSRTLGPFWGFQESWLTFIGSVFDMAIYPLLFSAYLANLLPKFFGESQFPVLGIGMIVLCVAMNLHGTNLVGRGSIVFVLLLLAPFAALVFCGFELSPRTHPTTSHITQADLLGGILIAMWNYMGWDNTSTIAGDVKNARRTYSLAMAISLVAVMITYILPIAAAERAGIHLEDWQTGSWAIIAEILGGRWLGLTIVAAGAVAAMSTFNALVLSLSRLPYVMARDGFLPKIFARENRYGAPYVAIIVCAAFWAAAMGLGFRRTIMLDVLLTGASILLEFAALIAWHVKKRGSPLVALLLAAPPAILIMLCCVRNHAERVGPANALLLGSIIALLGFPLYYFRRNRKSQPLA